VALGQPAHQPGAHHGHELHQQDGDDDGAGGHAELLVGVDRRLRDHRLDAVVVEQVRGQEQQRHRGVAEMAEGGAQLREARPQDAAGHRGGDRPVAQPQQRHDREPGPPHRRRDDADAHRGALRQRDGAALGHGEQHQVEGEQQPAAEVAEGPALGGDRVALVGGGDVGQEGGVHHVGRAVGHGREQEQPAAEQVTGAGHEPQQQRGGGADVGEQAEQEAPPAGAVGDRAEYRHAQHLQQRRQRHQVRVVGAGAHRDAQRVHVAAGVGGGPRHRGQVGAGEHGDDGRLEGRVGPVVDVPAALLGGGAGAGGHGLRHGRIIRHAREPAPTQARARRRVDVPSRYGLDDR
jgi:hypothetical protein